MFEIIFTLKVRYRDAAGFFGRRSIAGYVTENEGNRCARERAFNVKIISNTYLIKEDYTQKSLGVKKNDLLQYKYTSLNS